MNSDTILKVLDELGKRIAGPAEQVWGIYLKQIIAYGIADIAVGIALLIAGLLGIKFCCKHWDDNEIDETLGTVSFCSVLCGVPLGVLMLIRGFMLIYNPAYYVIQDLASTVIK